MSNLVLQILCLFLKRRVLHTLFVVGNEAFSPTKTFDHACSAFALSFAFVPVFFSLSFSLSLVARRVGLFFFLTRMRGRRTQLTGLHHAVFERVFLLVRGRGLLLLLLRLLLFREGGVGGGGPRSSPSGEAGESRRRHRRLGWTGGKHGDFALQSALTLVVVVVVGSSTTRRCFEEWRIVLTVVVVVVVVVSWF